MTIELAIAFDGDLESLRQHRLSLAAFGKSLTLLLAGLRQAAKKTERGVVIDLELQRVDTGSSDPVFVVSASLRADNVFPSLQGFMANEAASNAAQSFVRDVEREAKGERVSVAARRYLAALPSQIKKQRYAVRRDGVDIYVAPISNVIIAHEVEPDLDRLRTVECTVLGVHFAPAAPRVELLVDGKQQWCEATLEQVESALAMRANHVYATIVGRHPSWHLVALRDRPFTPPSPEERLQLLTTRWAGLLERLAS